MPQPLYERTRQAIQRLIEDGLRAGELLPTQAELARRFGTSLITVRRAMSELERAGLVQSVRGRGTVVCDPVVTDRLGQVTSWTDSVAGLGRHSQTGWSTVTREVPEVRIRHLLGLKARQAAIRLERLRLVGNEPVCLMTNLLPAARVPGMERTGLAGESLYRFLRERYGIVPASATETVSARLPTPAERRQLGRGRYPVMVVERLTLDTAGKPMEWAVLVARADRYSFQIKLFNRHKAPA